MIQDIEPHYFSNHYEAGLSPEDNDFVLHIENNQLLLRSENDELIIPLKKEVATGDQDEFIFLFRLNEKACFLAMNKPQSTSNTLAYHELSFFRTASRKEMAWAGLVGYHLHNWYINQRYCGKCGSATKHKEDERALVCPECHSLFFPKISPAIIVAITCNDKILLARNSNFAGGWYSLIAGYTDIGETIEETVRREVKEEVGLDIDNLRYYCSQPWPLSGSMMIGFTANADDKQEILIDNKEIVEAAWFSADNMPAHPANVSIAGEMIEKFMQGKL